MKRLVPRLPSPTSRRAGLAPLELVLTLPILLMMLALMINFGVIGAWKIRTQGNAHYATFRTVHVRTGDWSAPPPNWPNASLSAGGGNGLPQVGQLWDSHPDTSHPRADWVRGDWLTAPHAQTLIHVEGRLEFDAGVHSGTAAVNRPVPLLRGATSNGRFSFNLTQNVLDNRWQFHSLGIGDNAAPRTRVWWDIEHSDLSALDPAISQYLSRLDNAQQRMMALPRTEYLKPWDQDIEFHIYGGSTGWHNFYPRLRHTCSLDAASVQQDQVADLLDRIERLPCTVAQSYINLYATWICRMERCGANAQATAPLRDRHDALRQFVNALPQSMRCSRVGALQPCDLCDPMDVRCLSQCPAPVPDQDGL